MSDVLEVRIFDRDGRELWSGTETGMSDVLGGMAGENTAVGAMAGLESVPTCSKNDVMRTAEELEFVSRRGMPKGFLTTLPAGKAFESSVDAFNLDHLESLEVTPVDFPLIFDSSGDSMADLIEPYHLQGRTFNVTEGKNLRLSYAADPNLFNWLQGRTLDEAALPYAVYSPQPVFRNFRSGELSIQRTRQFTVPDIHVLASRDQVADRYLHALELAAESTRFWFGDDYVHVLDSVAGSTNDRPDFYSRAAKAAGGITVVRRLAKRPKYYAQKTGILVWSGYDNVMLYNLQLDEVNPVRFGIHVSDGSYPVVIHACVAMGLSRMMPLVLGRGISGVTPRSLPVELSPSPLALIPVKPEHSRRADAVARNLLLEGVRATVVTEHAKSIGARLTKMRRTWQSRYAIIGDRELDQQALVEDLARAAAAVPIEQFMRDHGDRIRRCTPSRLPAVRRLPFLNPS